MQQGRQKRQGRARRRRRCCVQQNHRQLLVALAKAHHSSRPTPLPSHPPERAPTPPLISTLAAEGMLHHSPLLSLSPPQRYPFLIRRSLPLTLRLIRRGHRWLPFSNAHMVARCSTNCIASPCMGSRRDRRRSPPPEAQLHRSYLHEFNQMWPPLASTELAAAPNPAPPVALSERPSCGCCSLRHMEGGSWLQGGWFVFS